MAVISEAKRLRGWVTTINLNLRVLYKFRNEKRYKIMKFLLHHPLCQWLYRRFHPNFGLWLADSFSRMGPKHKFEDLKMLDDTKEYQISFALETLKQQKINYFIFGHRHIALQRKLNEQSTLINLGDWLQLNTYAEFDGENIALKKY